MDSKNLPNPNGTDLKKNAEPFVAQDSILAGIKGQDRILGYRLH